MTIFGESAGAQSVIALLSSSATQGLYSAAIAQSAPWLPWVSREYYASGLTPAVAQAVNCTSTDEASLVSCLKTVDGSLFVANATVDAASKAAAANATSALASGGEYIPK